MSERQEHPNQTSDEASVEGQLAEFDRLDAEWQELLDLHRAAKDLLYTSLSRDLVEKLPEIEQELAKVHRRQHEVIDLQAALEVSILPSLPR